MFDFSTKSCGCHANHAAEAQRDLSMRKKKKKEKHTKNILARRIVCDHVIMKGNNFKNFKFLKTHELQNK